jgi:hypothetical protein
LDDRGFNLRRAKRLQASLSVSPEANPKLQRSTSSRPWPPELGCRLAPDGNDKLSSLIYVYLD